MGDQGLSDTEYWERRAEELRPQLDELQRRFDEGDLPPADDIEALGEHILKSLPPEDIA